MSRLTWPVVYLARHDDDGIDFVVDADGTVLCGPAEHRDVIAQLDLGACNGRVGESIQIPLGRFVVTLKRVRDPARSWFLVRLAPRPVASAAALTSRQLEVARLAALGRRNQEIGTALACSINTVRSHLRAVYERLGVTNRVELLRALGME